MDDAPVKPPTILVEPGADKAGKPLIVRGPDGRQLPAGVPTEVPRTSYWMRRLRDNDVVEIRLEKKKPRSKRTAAPQPSEPEPLPPEE